MGTRTALDYVGGLLCIEIGEDTALNILEGRGITADTLYSSLSIKQKELLMADIYMWCYALPCATPKIKDADGDWSHEVGAATYGAADKNALRRAAVLIYKKYGEYVPNSTVTVRTKGLKVWR